MPSTTNLLSSEKNCLLKTRKFNLHTLGEHLKKRKKLIKSEIICKIKNQYLQKDPLPHPFFLSIFWIKSIGT